MYIDWSLSSRRIIIRVSLLKKLVVLECGCFGLCFVEEKTLDENNGFGFIVAVV